MQIYKFAHAHPEAEPRGILLIKAVGFKLFYSHAHNNGMEVVWDYLRGLDDFKVIHIKRKNTFHSLVSAKIALENGCAKYPDWVVTEIQQLNMGSFLRKINNDNIPTIEIDYQECLHYFNTIKKEKEHCENFFKGQPVLDLYYENMLTNIDKECEKICNFLHLNFFQLNTYIEKQISTPMRQVVKNYYELKKSFEGTIWLPFFDE